MCFRLTQILRFGSLGFGPEGRLLISTPLYSNTTLSALIPGIALGMQIVILRKFDARTFLAMIESQRITHSMMVPVQIRRVLAHPEFDRFDLSSHQRVLSTSAPLTPAIMQEMARRWPGGLTNVFGMTEGGIATVLNCDQTPDKLHTVGRPGPTAKIVVLDAGGKVLSQGETGEIAGRSGAMMRGYVGDAEKTRATIWTSPEGEHFIRSGDMGFLDQDGYLVLLDRQKDMIISGGFNIYPVDLEAAISADSAIAECSVIGLPSEEWGETPVAWVVLRPGHSATAGQILHEANSRLGRYQHLTAVRFIDRLPRSEIGKVLKTELRKLWQED